jgi:hypothetical protein
MTNRPPYVCYQLHELRRTPSEHRDVSTVVSLGGGGYVSFSFWERVSGSTEENVKTLRFRSEDQRKATEEEQSWLIEALLNAGVFELRSEATNPAGGYYTHLDVQIRGRGTLLSFDSPPTTGSRKVIHDILFQFARQIGIDRPSDPAAAMTVSEGDNLPARATTIADLLADPAKFHGKRVSVAGFYHGGFECSALGVNQWASIRSDRKRSIWRGDPSTFTKLSAIFGKNNAWVRVDGVFLKGPAGHIGIADGQIVRLTRVRPVLPPMSASGIIYILTNILIYLGGLLIWPLCAFVGRKRNRRTTALRWVFCSELLCLLVMIGVALFSNLLAGSAFFWFWGALNLAFTLAAVGAARFDFTRSQIQAV